MMKKELTHSDTKNLQRFSTFQGGGGSRKDLPKHLIFFINIIYVVLVVWTYNI